MAGLLQALPRNLAYGISALIDQRGGAPAPEAEPAGRGARPGESSAEEAGRIGTRSRGRTGRGAAGPRPGRAGPRAPRPNRAARRRGSEAPVAEEGPQPATEAAAEETQVEDTPAN